MPRTKNKIATELEIKTLVNVLNNPLPMCVSYKSSRAKMISQIGRTNTDNRRYSYIEIALNSPEAPKPNLK